MLHQILTATYSSGDVGYALQHPKFANHQREVTRARSSILPRRAAPGPGGGEYRYAHVVEHALLMSIGVRRGRDISRAVFLGLARELSGNSRGNKKINNLPDDERHAIMFGGTSFEDADYPDGAPKDLARIVDYPTIFFDEDFISRDPAKPTFLLYENEPVPGAALVILTGDRSLGEAQAELIERKLYSAGSEDMKEIVRERFDDIPALNLTTLLARIDERLKLRLKARSIRGS